MKEIEENLFKLEKHFSSFKKYCYQDGFKHRNIRDTKFIHWNCIQSVN